MKNKTIQELEQELEKEFDKISVYSDKILAFDGSNSEDVKAGIRIGELCQEIAERRGFK